MWVICMDPVYLRVFLNENYFNLLLIYICIFICVLFQVLKTVENLGVSYVRNSDQYSKKLEAEFLSLNFPYRTELVRIHSSYTFFIYLCLYLQGIHYCWDFVVLQMSNIHCIDFARQIFFPHNRHDLIWC